MAENYLKYRTGVTLRRFTKPKIAFYFGIVTLFVFVALMPAERLHWWSTFERWHNAHFGSPSEVSAAVLWLLMANITSFFAVWLLFAELDALQQKVRSEVFTLNEDLAREWCGVSPGVLETVLPIDWALKPLNKTLWVTRFVNSGTIVIITLIFTSHPQISTAMLITAVLWTGLFYLSLITAGDYHTYRAYRRFVCLERESGPKRGTGEDVMVGLTDTLSDYQRIFWYSDLPILGSLTLVVIHHFAALDEGTYYLGFVAGAVAMHTIIANITAVMIAGSSTVALGRSLDESVGRTSGRRSVYLALAAVCATVLIAAIVYIRHETTFQPLRVAVMRSAGVGPGFVAKEHDFFGALPVNLMFFNDPAALADAYRRNEVDMYMTTLPRHWLNVPGDGGGKVVLVLEQMPDGGTIVANPSIKAVSDLCGRRVAYVQEPGTDAVLQEALRSAGLQPADVDLVSMDATYLPEALGHRDVDAVVYAADPMAAGADERNARVLYSCSKRSDNITVLVAKEPLAKDRRRLKQFVFGWLRSVDYVRSNPCDSYSIIARQFGVPEANVRGMMEHTILADLSMNCEFFKDDKDGLSQIDRIADRAAGYWRSIGRLRTPLPSKVRRVSAEMSGLLSRQP